MKTYKVWVEIEEYDTETQEGTILDSPGAAVYELETYNAAWNFAMRLSALKYFALNESGWSMPLEGEKSK